MAHHKSCKKRMRQSAVIRERNRLYSKTMRNSVRDLRAMENKSEAQEKLHKTKRNQIHKNKAANLKSSLTKFVNSL